MRALLAAAAVAGAAAASAAAAPIPGKLVGLFALGDSLANLTVMSLDPNTGANATLGYVSLGPIQQTFPARSAYDPSTGQLLVAVATATHIYGVDVNTGAATQLAALPKYDGTDPYLGLIRVNGINFFITQHNLYILDKANTVLQRVSAPVGLPDDALVTANPTGGTNGEGVIFLGNATIPHHNSTLPPYIWRIDLGKDNAIDTITVRGEGGSARMRGGRGSDKGSGRQAATGLRRATVSGRGRSSSDAPASPSPPAHPLSFSTPPACSPACSRPPRRCGTCSTRRCARRCWRSWRSTT